MTTLSYLQNYWWLLISTLGAALVFLLFIQGGQSYLRGISPSYRPLIINSLGRKWEFTFTTLVVFGGAFFASFPLFYSTSFGGAYWLWMLILLSFVVQAFSYEFRIKKGNIYGTSTYDLLLEFNGLFGCVLLGVAVGTMIFGGNFEIRFTDLTNPVSPVISRWCDSHGLEAILSWRCLLLGFVIFFLARTQAALYFINNINVGSAFDMSMRIKTLLNGGIFAVLFIIFAIVLFLTPGLRFNPATNTFDQVQYIYWENLLTMWWTIPMLLIGVVAVLFAIAKTVMSKSFKSGIWFSGIGTVLVIMVVFFLIGYNNTAYLPSLSDPQSSLCLANSSSSQFTLTVMSWVSILVPIVLVYISIVWRKMNNTPLTRAEIDSDSHKY